MAKARKRKFRVGQPIRVRVRGLPYAVIVRFMSDVEGGVVLDRQVDGFCCWNVEKLRPLTKREFGPRSPSASKEE
jgi:hypothetical protein